MATSVSAELLSKLESLRSALEGFAPRLEEARKEQDHLRSVLRLLQPKITDRENEVEILVHGETKPDGKPVFPNDATRKTESRKRLAADAEYQSMLKEQLWDKVAIENAERQVLRIEDERRSIEKQADIVMKAADIIIAKVTLDSKLNQARGA